MKRVLIAATALGLLCSGAYAQSYSDSGSNANATNSSASQSSSVSNPRVNVIGNPIGNGASSSYSNAGASANTRSSSTSSAVGNRSNLSSSTNITVNDASGNGSGTSGGDPTIRYEGGYTVRNTPEVIPPTIAGGNTCAVGASAGLALPGFGLAGGATWADKACERRQQAALLFNMGNHKAAFALMCQDDHVREAMGAAGEPCLPDRPVASAPAAVAPAAIAASAAVAPPAIVAASPARAVVAPKPNWCTSATVSPAHLNSLSEGQRMYIRLHCGV